MKSKKSFFWIANIIVPLLIGFVLYLILRPDTYISQFAYKLLKISPWNTLELSNGNGQWLLQFLRNFASDILWAYAVTFTCCLIIANNKGLWISTAICTLFELLIEIFQKIQIFSGTFDVLDVIFEFITTLVAVLIIKIHDNYISEE